MSITLQNLIAAYRDVHRLVEGEAPRLDHLTQINQMATSIDAGRDGQPSAGGWSYTAATQWIHESAKATTQVAILSYGFLLEQTVGTAGLDYLVSAAGPNPHNLNSAYYAAFNIENRYINFAVALVKFGDARSGFLAAYGEEQSVFATARLAYQKLFGVDKPMSFFVDLMSDLVPDGRGGQYTRGEYFAQIGGDGGNGLGTRAAVVGWLTAEAAKAGQGPYVEAMNAVLADLAVDGRLATVNAFLSLYGPGGDNALGGPSAAGLRGETARFAPDWDVAVAKPDAASAVHALATEGNDILRPIIADVGGLQAGRTISTGGGNDIVQVDNGPLKGRVDLGSGNDMLFVDKFDGRVATGSGYDAIAIDDVAAMHLNGAEPTDIAVIEDFEKGRDLVEFAAVVGPGAKLSLATSAGATLGQVLAQYSALTLAGANTVFEWKGDTYIYRQDAMAGVSADDSLIKLAGATGLSVANAANSAVINAGDIIFGG